MVSLVEDIVNLQSGVPPARHHRPQSHYRLCQSTTHNEASRYPKAWRALTGVSFHWPFGLLTFSHTHAHKHRVLFGSLKIGRRLLEAEYGIWSNLSSWAVFSHLVRGGRSDAALCFFAAFPGQAIHVVRTLVELGGCDDQRRRDESLMMFPWLARRLSTTSLSVIPPLFTALPCELVTHALNSIKGLCF